jgi:nucleoside-diphosphate-sugar epimerase
MNPGCVLVTGASGCLGRPLANRLAREGRTVIGLDIVPAGEEVAFTGVTGDVGDAQGLRELFVRYDFDAVVHCGGISGQMVAPDDPYRNCRVNVFGTVELLETARIHKVGRFIYGSSQGAYGTSPRQEIKEETAFLPVTVYGATKAACDLIARAYRLQHGLDVTSLRIGRVYGPGRRTGSLITTMMKAAVAGRPLRLPASDGRRLQYVYEDDIVTALHQALLAPCLPQPAYNVSGPGSHSDEDIAETVRSLVPGADITFESVPLDDGSFPGAPLDCSAARRDFGFAPQYDLDSGLAAFLASLQNRQGSTS